MPTIEKISNNSATELPHGTVAACTPADRATLTDLYRACFPDAGATQLAADIRDEESPAWMIYRDDQGECRVAMRVGMNGITWLLAKPEECQAPEVRHGFLVLTQEAQRALALQGVQVLMIMYPASLKPLADLLEQSGLIGRELAILRSIHFDERGKVARTN